MVFSISHAIVSGEEGEVIKHSTKVNIRLTNNIDLTLLQIYFICLYWISISWIIFCMVNIIRHRNRVKVPTDSNRTNLIGDVNRQTSITSVINVQLLDEIEEDLSDESDNEPSEINNNKPSTDNDDTHHKKSNSLGNLAHHSSVTKPSTDTTQEAVTRYDDQLLKNSLLSIFG